MLQRILICLLIIILLYLIIEQHFSEMPYTHSSIWNKNLKIFSMSNPKNKITVIQDTYEADAESLQIKDKIIFLKVVSRMQWNL